MRPVSRPPSSLASGRDSCSLTFLLGNDEIENQLKRDRLMAKNEIKMLLLGAGESGKVCSLSSVPSGRIIDYLDRCSAIGLLHVF